MHRLLLVAGSFVAVAWGASFLLIREALALTGPFGVAFGRIALGALVLNVLPQSRGAIPARDHGRLLLLAVVWMVVPMVLFPVAEQRVSSAVAGILNGSAPLWTAAVAALLHRRLPSRSRAGGLAIGFLGVLVVTLYGTDGTFTFSADGIVLILLAVACYGLAFNLTGALQQRHGALPVVARSMTIAAVVLAPLGLPDLLRLTFSTSGAIALIVLGLASTGAAFTAFTWITGHTDATSASVITYAIPIVAVGMGVGTGERVQLFALAGIPLILLGAALAQRTRA